jgi:hypothetical protein|tara:strand:- start:678 stop:1556 length:879 start_codon:yes stop_codon:yes gene_type:complete
MSNTVINPYNFVVAGGGATSDIGICAGGSTATAANTNAQTSSSYVWSNISALSTARQYTFGVGNANNFTIAGGYLAVNNSQTWNGSAWATEIALDTERRDTTAIAGSYNDCIVANGRNTAGTLLDTSSTFNGTTWSGGATAGTAREHPAGSGARDSMLVAGGYTAAPSTLVDSYDGSSFSTETAMPTASYGQSLAASAYDSAHITGGYSTFLYTGTYDGSAWTATTSYPVSQTHYFGGGGGVIDDHLCMGGYKADGGIVKYDTTNLWNGTAWVAKGNLTEIKYGGGGDCTAR